jgi:dihydrofolate reductase
MSKVIVSSMLSLDGVVEAPERWAFQFWDDEISAWSMDELLDGDTLLLGRTTYEGFVAYWPSATEPPDIAARMNSMPKLVASTTLAAVTWNATLLRDDVAAQIAQLKRGPGGDILLLASADLTQTLIHHDLVDEYRLRVAPIVVGSGARLFREAEAPTNLDLVVAKHFASGFVALTYRVRR